MNIRFDRPSPSCSSCGKPFKDNEHFTTTLSSTEEPDVFFRKDICDLCWPSQNADAFHCFWANEFTAKRRPILLDADALWQLFHRTWVSAKDDDESARFAFVAALGLMRLKRLELEDSVREDGRRFLKYRTKGKKRMYFLVPDLNLSEEDMEAVQERLSELAGELNFDDDDSGDDGNDEAGGEAEDSNADSEA